MQEFFDSFREARTKLSSLPSAKSALDALDSAEGHAKRAQRIFEFYNEVLKKKHFQAKPAAVPVRVLLSQISSTQYVNRKGHEVKLNVRRKTGADTKLKINLGLFLDGFGVIASDAGGSPNASGKVSAKLSLSREGNAVRMTLVRRNRTLEEREQDRPLTGKLGAQTIIQSAGAAFSTKNLSRNRTRYDFSLPLAA